MPGRRSDDRFEIADPWTGSLRLLREVIVRPEGDRGVTVISRTGAFTGETMRLDVQGAAAATTLRVQVAGSRPVAYDGSVRHAVHVEVVEGRRPEPADDVPGAAERARPLANMLAAADADLAGVLTRDVPVRMRNVSGSGCLLESASAIEAGKVVRLRMRIGDRAYVDEVRVVWCRRLEGAGSTYHAGVEFAWTTRPGTRSLRRKVREVPGRIAPELVARAEV